MFSGLSVSGKQQQFCKLSYQYEKNFQIAKVAHHNDAHIGREIREVRAV